MPDWRFKGDPVADKMAIYAKKTPNVASTSSLAVQTGSRTFVVAAGLPISIDDWFWCEAQIVSGGVTYPTVHAMVGYVTAYSGTSLTINVTRAIGSGTFTSWRLVDHTPLYDSSSVASMQRLQWSIDNPVVSTTLALTQSASITIPAQALGSQYQNVFNLFAHGRGVACEVDGRILNFLGAGNHLTIAGSTPIWMQTIGGSDNGFGIMIEIGCNTTHVVAIVRSILASSGTTSGSIALTIEASVYDFTTAAAMPDGNPALPFANGVAGSYTQLGRGRVDTRRRYPHKVDSGHDVVYPKSETLTIVGRAQGDDPGANPSYAQAEIGWRWRYSCDGYVKQTERAWNGTATNGGTANADFLRVKRT